MKYLIAIIIFLAYLTLYMGDKNFEYVITGKLLIEKENSLLEIIEDSTRKIVYLPNNDESRRFESLIWLNDSFLVGNELIFDNGKLIKINLVKIEIQNFIIERIMTVKNYQFCGQVFPSYLGKKIFFSKHSQEFNFKNYSDIPVDFYIMNDKYEIIKEYENICTLWGFEINESPWSIDEKRLVYSFTNLYKNDTSQKSTGIYILDSETGEEERINEKGRDAVWSPIEDKIAYISNQDIVLYDLITKSKEIIYKNESFESIGNLHWTPDGKYLFFTSHKDFLNLKLFHSYDEKLLRISDFQLIKFDKLNIGNAHFSWK